MTTKLQALAALMRLTDTDSTEDFATAFEIVEEFLRDELEEPDAVYKAKQVSSHQFLEIVRDKEDCIGAPIIWAEWPSKELK